MKATIFAFFFSVSLAAAGPAIVFQQLPVDESIHVTYTSIGCFHSVTYEFIFEHAKAFTAKITQVEYQWDQAKKRPVEAKRTDLGEVTLSENEIIGLDRLFAFYRSKNLGGCTTMDQISATQKKGDFVKATESFTDESCATSNMKDITRFDSIVAKLEPKTK